MILGMTVLTPAALMNITTTHNRLPWLIEPLSVCNSFLATATISKPYIFFGLHTSDFLTATLPQPSQT